MGSGPAQLGEIPPWARRDPGEVGWKFSIWTQFCRAELKARDWGRMRVCNQDGRHLWKWIDKEKRILLESEMIGNLVTCLMAYKARMEYQALDFDGDRPTQYK